MLQVLADISAEVINQDNYTCVHLNPPKRMSSVSGSTAIIITPDEYIVSQISPVHCVTINCVGDVF